MGPVIKKEIIEFQVSMIKLSSRGIEGNNYTTKQPFKLCYIQISARTPGTHIKQTRIQIGRFGPDVD